MKICRFVTLCVFSSIQVQVCEIVLEGAIDCYLSLCVCFSLSSTHSYIVNKFRHIRPLSTHLLKKKTSLFDSTCLWKFDKDHKEDNPCNLSQSVPF